MFNPEKLLGGLIKSGMRGKGLGSMATGGAALGLVGVAMAAAEHYMNRPKTDAPGGPPPTPGAQHMGMQGGYPPPSAGAPSAPPPAGASSPPPPPPGGAAPVQTASKASDAVLLIRAMIAAANADGVIDADERGRILERLKSVNLTEEEHQFIVHELLAPKSLEDIADAVRPTDLQQQVYAASLLAITVDTDAERQYLTGLADKLGLDARTVDAIHRQLGK